MKIKQLIQAMLLLLSMIVMLTLPAYALSKPTELAGIIELLDDKFNAKHKVRCRRI